MCFLENKLNTLPFSSQTVGEAKGSRGDVMLNDTEIIRKHGLEERFVNDDATEMIPKYPFKHFRKTTKTKEFISKFIISMLFISSNRLKFLSDREKNHFNKNYWTQLKERTGNSCF